MDTNQRKGSRTRSADEDSERRGKIPSIQEEEEEDNDKPKNGLETKDNDIDKNSDNQDDLSMFDDEDDDGEGELYGRKRNRPDFSTGAPPGSFEMYALNRQELEDRRVRHHQIIRKILAEFDIEEVKERYRGKGIIRDFSHANRKFRMWLEKVMGNDNVQLSDRKWQELFRQKVTEDYEHKLKERERQLAEAEVQRIQRLRLQGILTSDDTRETTKGFGNGNRCKKKTRKTLSDHSSRHQDLYTRPLDDIETQMEMINKDNASKGNRTPNMQDSEDDDAEATRHEGRRVDGRKVNDKKTNGNSVQREDNQESFHEEDGDSANNKENDTNNNGHLGMSGSIRPDKNPDIQYLYKEEDLHQLYARAEQLIRPSKYTSSK